MNIAELAYELYKEEWKSSHNVTREREKRELVSFFKDLTPTNEEEYTYKKHIEEYGYGGEIYPCFSEFLETEFLDTTYMQALLSDEELMREYRQYLKVRKYPSQKVNVDLRALWEYKVKPNKNHIKFVELMYGKLCDDEGYYYLINKDGLHSCLNGAECVVDEITKYGVSLSGTNDKIIPFTLSLNEFQVACTENAKIPE